MVLPGILYSPRLIVNSTIFHMSCIIRTSGWEGRSEEVGLGRQYSCADSFENIISLNVWTMHSLQWITDS